MDKPHIVISGFSTAQDFQSKSIGRTPGIPERNRGQHGHRLLDQYNQAMQTFDAKRAKSAEPISEERGIYLEIRSLKGYELPLNSLDTSRDFKLRSISQIDDQEVAVVFVPEDRRTVFSRKIEAFLDPERDTIHPTAGARPRNRRLIQSIEQVKLANIRSFWTDAHDRFPEDASEEVWWEIWLKKSDGEDPIALIGQFAERVGVQLGKTSLSFFDISVVVAKASCEQLELAIEMISSLSELRKAKAAPSAIVNLPPIEQAELAEELIEKSDFGGDELSPILVLDGGVNFNQPILAAACRETWCVAWDPDWPLYDEFDPDKPYKDINAHGSAQAGLMLYGDISEVLIGDEPISVSARIESGRILPPIGQNDPELYGAITANTAAMIDASYPDSRRIYSLAVTAEPDRLGGQPTSWSSEIDYYSCGAEDGISRLFVISAGNNEQLDASVDYWTQVQLAQIEDPAQSWNAITVGAFTEKVNNNDPSFDGWNAWSESGDVSPSSRSAVNWAWRKHAPLKPDVVAEGGNRLISQDELEVSDADTVRLLTTSGRTVGPLFETSGDSSAATALVSRLAAMLTSQYPDMRPETIRGLVVHSADWSDAMTERHGILLAAHAPKVAGETMLSIFGHGVPDIERARYSANHALTLVAEGHLQPFLKAEDARPSDDPKLNEMVLHDLPWPTEILSELGDTEVRLRVTLSYFVEPNPGRRGYRTRYSYQSYGLRYEVIRPGQTIENFLGYVNGLAVNDDYDGPEGDNDGWKFGQQLRRRGSLHSDTWTGPAVSLADMNSIAVFPVGGWWKYRTALDRWRNSVFYSLIVSIETPDEDVDIYTEISNQIQVEVDIEI